MSIDPTAIDTATNLAPEVSTAAATILAAIKSLPTSQANAAAESFSYVVEKLRAAS